MIIIIKIFDGLLEKLSRIGLVACLFIILLFSVAAIVARWMGNSNLWIEPLVRHIVFLSAFLGGSLATSKGVHIRVDLLSRLIDVSNSRFLKWLHHNLISLFCLVTTVALMLTSFDFFKVEREFGAPSFLNIHSSWLVFIIPLGMGLIALRFLNQLILGMFTGESREPDHL